MNLTIDASVFVAAAHSADFYHTPSASFIRDLQQKSVDIFCPTLILVECAAAMARQSRRQHASVRIVNQIETYPNLQLVALDISLARQAALIARTQRLRGADAVYVAVAQATQSTLVTWDAEVLQRGQAAVVTLTPTQASVIL